jgi:hypothetical protein
MEQNQPNQPKEVHESQATKAQEEPENLETAFCDRPYEEVEDGFIDDRGFYTTPNGSFWDDEHTYFNHLGFDRHGGTYDKYGIYQPGVGYDETTGLYNDQKEFITAAEKEIVEKNIELSISKLKEQETNDEKTIKKYEKLEEESEDSDDEDKSNVTYDDDEIKEAYEFVMENENRNENITTNPKNNKSKKSQKTDAVNGQEN